MVDPDSYSFTSYFDLIRNRFTNGSSEGFGHIMYAALSHSPHDQVDREVMGQAMAMVVRSFRDGIFEQAFKDRRKVKHVQRYRGGTSQTLGI